MCSHLQTSYLIIIITSIRFPSKAFNKSKVLNQKLCSVAPEQDPLLLYWPAGSSHPLAGSSSQWAETWGWCGGNYEASKSTRAQCNPRESKTSLPGLGIKKKKKLPGWLAFLSIPEWGAQLRGPEILHQVSRETKRKDQQSRKEPIHLRNLQDC